MGFYGADALACGFSMIGQVGGDMENDAYDWENRRSLEQVIWIIYAFYALVMIAMSFLQDWHTWVPAVVIVTLILSAAVHFRKYRDYRFRALFVSCMAWLDFTIYGIHAKDYFSILSTMSTMIVLLGMYCLPEIEYLAMLSSTFLLVIHGLVLRTIHITLDTEGARLILQILSVYMVEYITYYLVNVRIEGNRRQQKFIEGLKRAEASKDDFVANVSHEIRTPVNTICGMSEMALREEISDQVREDIYDIQTAGRNLLSVVSDILDFSELSSGKLDLVEEPYNITSTINDIMNMAIAKDNGKNLEFVVDCDADIPCAMVGDEQKIRRAVMNIVDNAIKFTKEGGIVLRISSRKEEYGVNLLVSVEDTGIGMDERTLERLFTTYNQVDTKRNRQEGGIGLGLAISKTIAERMGGFVSAKSTLGKGSELMLTIPQKVADERPIVSVADVESIRVVSYLGLDNYDYAAIRRGYEDILRHLSERLGVRWHQCRNLSELKRRMEKKDYSHVFIGWEEYCEDRAYFDGLSEQKNVVLVQPRDRNEVAGGRMMYLYKPFSVLSIAAVLNGEQVAQKKEKGRSQDGHFVAPDARILVVDDNYMNLRVAEGLLRPYQVKVFTASSGEEALQKVETMDYDFIFMDHMMPEMDGVEALHRIRSKPGKYFQNVPVIALTANAIGGARQMFLEEGFADFVAKPIELSALERVLLRYLPESKVHFLEKGSHGEQKGESEGLPKTEGVGIDVELGLRYSGGSIEDYEDILRIYYTSGQTKKKEIEEAYSKQDWETYTIHVHALKSLSLGIGASSLSEQAKELEAAGKGGDIPYILAHHEETMASYGQVLDAIGASPKLFPKPDKTGAARGGQETDNPQGEWGNRGDTNTMSAGRGGSDSGAYLELSKERLQEELSRLREQLDGFEQEGVEALATELGSCSFQGQPLTELLAAVLEKARMFDFMGAEEALDALEEEMG